jgi:expansin (peptidoglycan-binding protein)
MRRSIVLVMGCLLAVAVIVALPGCGGGDTRQAKQYMQSGDDAVNKLNAQSSQWQSQATTALSSAGDPAANVASLEQVKASMTGISTAVAAAKAEYQKIKGLKGVDDYVRYAAMRVEALDLVQQLLDKANELFDKRIAMESSGDRSGADAAQQSFSEDVQSITARITKLDEEAQKLQSEKNL